MQPLEGRLGGKSCKNLLKNGAAIEGIATIEQEDDAAGSVSDTFVEGVRNAVVGLADPLAEVWLWGSFEPGFDGGVFAAVNDEVLVRGQGLGIHRSAGKL